MTQTTDLRGVVPGRRPRDRSGGLALAVILLGQFMAILDVNIVNVALPTMRADLHASGSSLQLVVAGYIISYAVLLITGARLGDIAGHRRMFHLGLAVFAAASLACGLAPSTGALVVFRFLQGAGAALLTPQVMSMIQRGFTGAARARALGLYSAVIACGSVVGQVAGGCWSARTCSAPAGGRSSSSTSRSASRCCSRGRASCPATRPRLLPGRRAPGRTSRACSPSLRRCCCSSPR